jgi:hypothetical protein
MSEFLLKGLDGGNPLGFLAALGTLRTSQMAIPEDRHSLKWVQYEGAWRPVLAFAEPQDEATWLESLHRQLSAMDGHPALSLADNLNIPCADFRKATQTAQQTAVPNDRRYADYLAAFGCEACETELNGKKTGIIRDTAFRTMSGSGHQHFLGSMRTFVADTGVEHLRKALFEPWRYDDPLEKHTMRWDPLDDVRYALRWRNPSGDSDRKSGGSVWGANRLAIEAIPLFPTAPVGESLETTGFYHRRKVGSFWTWPIWDGPIVLDTLRSLLTLWELQKQEPPRTTLRAMGVVEVMRSQRITQGKFRNFSMAWPV